MLQECSSAQLEYMTKNAIRPVLVFFHSPFCGTCKVARRMLTVTLEALPFEAISLSCNLNGMPELSAEWSIQSVPCLIIIHKGQVIRRLFAFQSVGFLYDVINQSYEKY